MDCFHQLIHTIHSNWSFVYDGKKMLGNATVPLREGSTRNISTDLLVPGTHPLPHLASNIQRFRKEIHELLPWRVWLHLPFEESTSYGFFADFLFPLFILFFQWMRFWNQASRKCSLNAPERSRIGLASQGESQALSYTIPMSLTSQLLQSTVQKQN